MLLTSNKNAGSIIWRVCCVCCIVLGICMILLGALYMDFQTEDLLRNHIGNCFGNIAASAGAGTELASAKC